MKRLLLSLPVISAIGCEGANEIVSSRVPTPTPTPRPTTYVIGGSVTRNGRAARNTTVTAKSSGQTWNTSTNSSGAHRFNGLPAGEFQVSAFAYYCIPATETVTIPPNATVDLSFIMCWRSPDGPNRSPD
jgi:hypothetical protein